MNPTVAIGIALLCVLLNAFFVATEFALVKVRSSRLDELHRAGSATAGRARRMLDKLDEHLSGTQLGITLASLALGWIGEPAFAHLIEPLARRAGLDAAATEASALAVSFATITFLHIVFGELAPKSLAIQRTEGTVLAVAWPMEAFSRLLYPAVWALNGAARLVLRPFGLGTAGHEQIHSEEELRLIVAAMRAHGAVSPERLDLLDRTLRLTRKLVRDLMVPRAAVATLRLDQTAEERLAAARAAGHNRLPVVDGDIDHVVGLLDLRELFVRGTPWPADEAALRRELRAPLFVPETMKVDRLLLEMRAAGQRVALVVDEYGGTAGLVTSDDLALAIIGDMEGPVAPPRTLAGGMVEIDPTLSLDELAHQLHAELPRVDVSSAGGLVVTLLQRIPAPGDRVSAGGVELIVEAMDGPRIARLLVRKLP